jgi:hypothetical protein
VNAYAPLYGETYVKLTTIPQGAVVIAHGIVDEFKGVPREAVSYVTEAREYHGYVYTGYLEPYVESLPARCVTIYSATPNPNDAEQYAMIHGVKQTELCGEICAAYLLNVALEDLLAEWQRESLSVYQRVFNWFSTRKAKGTGPADVQSMLAAFERNSRLLTDALRDPIPVHLALHRDGTLGPGRPGHCDGADRPQHRPPETRWHFALGCGDAGDPGANRLWRGGVV